MTSTSSVRQRGGQIPGRPTTPSASPQANKSEGLLKEKDIKSTITSEWDYKLALSVITALAFLTRFWGIGHPNEVVFDEVHFGKVWSLRMSKSRKLGHS